MQSLELLFILLVLLTQSFSCLILQGILCAQSLNLDAFLSAQCTTLTSLDGC